MKERLLVILLVIVVGTCEIIDMLSKVVYDYFAGKDKK